ncbi:helix-turn-helix domain-containing protein [Hydrogenophaga sp. BPS33]|uniref:helix-turn-helix domain-containing protein n=1 Tax=Hydrogenophaga sp. BPS33 TaxID=2651974 RepID=UPI0013203C7F|nr:helix-turn-helix transcriptional regulator [Hydrogenophaga sp. BPS33]QHE87223.1 helix-turn-helix transcriptional regulator [Hydrogenophaga sp. BPS33]
MAMKPLRPKKQFRWSIAMRDEPDAPAKSELFLKSSNQFRRALRRMINQSGTAPNGEVKSVSRQALSASAGIAASTLNKLLVSDEKAKEEPPNPTLEVICKLAAALNVSPGLLLLTEDDWKKLGSSVATYMALERADNFREFVSDTVLSNEYSGVASDVARDAQQIAQMCGFGSRATEAARTNIAATSQVLSFRGLNPEHRPLLMVICAIFALSATPPRTSPESNPS